MILSKLQQAASRYPEHIAVRMKSQEGYEQYTYTELLQAVASVSHALGRLGIGKGDRIALLSENRPEWIIAYIAVVAGGAIITPLDAQLTDEEVALLIQNAGAKAVFASRQTLRKLPQQQTFRIIAFDGGQVDNFRDIIMDHKEAELPHAPEGTAPAALLYTSGTTGDPKGVLLSHANLVSNCESVSQLSIADSNDNVLCLLPLHHSYPAMAFVHVSLSEGATITILNSLKGPDILGCMRETGVSVLVGVPQLIAGLRRAVFDRIRSKAAPIRPVVSGLLRLNGLFRSVMGVNLGRFLFSEVHTAFGPAFRLITSGGARLEPAVYTDMMRLGFTLIEGYGLSETSPVCTFNPLNRQKAGSIGIPLPGVEVRIANPDENGQGELAIRGPNVMMGYYEKPEATAEVIRDGWFYTGDLGYRDRDGYFFVTGRSKEMIVLPNGKKIFPEELEQFYLRIPSIKEICLLSTERGIEAAVVPNFEYLRKMNLPNSREVIVFEIEDLQRGLPPYRRIKGLKIFKDSLPVTRLGKLRRAKVRELYDREEVSSREAAPGMDQRELLEDPVMRTVFSCLEPLAGNKPIMPDDNLELDIGLDSLSRVEFIVSMEQAFGIKLPESFGSEVFTVRDVVMHIKNLLAAEAASPASAAVQSWSAILSQEPELAQSIRFEHGPLCRAAQYFTKLLLRGLFGVYGGMTVVGLENLPKGGPYLIAPNHVSFVDAPVVAASLSWRIASRTLFLGTADLFGGPVTSRIAPILNIIPVDMDAKLQGAMQLSAHALRHGNVLCIFPEGGRSRDGKLKKFKKGIGILAVELNAPIVPMAIRGAYSMLPVGDKFLKPARIWVSFGKPILPAGKAYDELVAELQQKMAEMLGES